MTAQVTEKKTSKYLINEHKLLKYMPRLLNGEAYMLKKWLPNLITTDSGISGSIEREGYDYWISLLAKREPQTFNTHSIQVDKKVDAARDAMDALVDALAEFKVAVDVFREKNRKQTFM